jgi:hypothetical protein
MVSMVSMVYRIGGFLTFKRNKILLGTMEVFLQYYCTLLILLFDLRHVRIAELYLANWPNAFSLNVVKVSFKYIFKPASSLYIILRMGRLITR